MLVWMRYPLLAFFIGPTSRSRGLRTLASFMLSFLSRRGISSGCGTQCLPLHCLHALAVISAPATRRVSAGSRGRGCNEWHCLQIAQDPNLHHCSTKAAGLDVTALGSPASFSAMSSALGFGRSFSLAGLPQHSGAVWAGSVSVSKPVCEISLSTRLEHAGSLRCRHGCIGHILPGKLSKPW